MSDVKFGRPRHPPEKDAPRPPSGVVKPRRSGAPARLAASALRMLQNLALAVASLLFSLVVLEVVLRLGWLEAVTYDKWSSPEDREADRLINARNQAIARAHPFGFVDRVRSVEPPGGIERRFAVLGDSFVWGDGVPYDVIWSHKLERRVARRDPSVEVLSWGQRGWSTADELDFLRARGVDFGIDLLIIGWVVNDLEATGQVEIEKFSWGRSPAFRVVKREFLPYAFGMIQASVNSVLRQYFYPERGYDAYLRRLASAENLTRYAPLLEEFASFCRDGRIDLLFVLTPSAHREDTAEIFDLVTPDMRRAGIEVLNLHPAISRRLAGVPAHELRANPGNGHPGDLVTEVYADEVFGYLVETGRLRASQPE